MSCARLQVSCPCSKSEPQVRGQFKGPSGAFVTYCNNSYLEYILTLRYWELIVHVLNSYLFYLCFVFERVL